jgi:hypothetical protein
MAPRLTQIKAEAAIRAILHAPPLSRRGAMKPAMSLIEEVESVLAAVALIGLLASSALAQPAGSEMGGQRMGPGPHMMRGQELGPGMGAGRGMRARVDQNRDGFVAAEEAETWYKTAFAAFDSNKDGALSQDEYLGTHMGRGPGTGPRAAQRREDKAKNFAEMDADKDGKVTNAEFLAWHQDRYRSADTNRDGKVNVTEFYAAMRP